MPTPLEKYVEQRTSILAQAFLTRQKGVYVTEVSGGELAMFELVAHVLPGEAENHGRAVRTFGVLTWGTEKAIPSVTAASRLANERWKGTDDVPLAYVPALALLFSMKDDRGYYAWAIRPWLGEDSTPHLSRPPALDCQLIGRDSLASVIDEVNAWYDQLDRLVFVG
jgi:hypothetical protein